MINVRFQISLVILVLLLSGCVPQAYQMGDKTFSSEDEAREYRVAHIQGLLDGVRPTLNPLGGSLLVTIPTEDQFLRVIRAKTQRSTPSLEATFPFLANVSRKDQEFFVDAIRARGIFDEVVVIDNGDDYPQRDFDWLLVADLRGNNLLFWFISRADAPDDRAAWFNNDGTITESVDELRAIICSEFSPPECTTSAATP